MIFKNRCRQIGLIIGLGALMVLSGCKNTAQVAGEGTNYPVTWKESSGGKVTVKLDGSASTDYSWKVVSTNDEILKVEAKNEEKNGIVTYVITPVSEGNAAIQISRTREAGPTMEEIKAALDEMKAVDEGEEEAVYVWDLLGEPIDATQGAFTISGVGEGEITLNIPDDEANTVSRIETSGMTEEEECRQYLMQDTVCDVNIQVNVVSVKKKYKASIDNVAVTEHNGLAHGGDETFGYDYWNVGKDLMVRMNGCPDGCITKVELDYTGNEEYGEDIALADITTIGIIKDWTYFRVKGWDNANGYLYIENPLLKKRLAALVDIDNKSQVSVVSAEIEEYRPSKEDLDEMTERTKEVISEKEDKSKEGQPMPLEESSEETSEGESEETPEGGEKTSEAGQ